MRPAGRGSGLDLAPSSAAPASSPRCESRKSIASSSNPAAESESATKRRPRRDRRPGAISSRACRPASAASTGSDAAHSSRAWIARSSACSRRAGGKQTESPFVPACAPAGSSAEDDLRCHRQDPHRAQVSRSGQRGDVSGHLVQPPRGVHVVVGRQQSIGRGEVDPPPARRPEVVVAGRTHDLVPERELAGADGDEPTVPDKTIERRGDPVLWSSRCSTTTSRCLSENLRNADTTWA